MDVERIRSMLMGFALGNALGFPHAETPNLPYTGKLEYRPERYNPYAGTRFLAVGQPTQDFEMAWSLAQSLVKDKGYDNESVLKAYQEWLATRPTGVDDELKKLMDYRTRKTYERKYEEIYGFPETVQPFSQESRYGNNVWALMRSPPLAILRDWRESAKEDAWLTTPNQVALDAELAYLYALRLALEGKTVKEIWKLVSAKRWGREVEKLVQDVKEGKKRSLQSVLDEEGRPQIGKNNALIPLYAVFYALKRISEMKKPDLKKLYPSMMEWVIGENPETDTDTNGALVGALIGALVGWKNLISDEETRENILTMAEYRSQPSDKPRPEQFDLKTIDSLAEELELLS